MSKEFRRQVPVKERLCIMVVQCFMTVSMLYRRVCYCMEKDVSVTISACRATKPPYDIVKTRRFHPVSVFVTCY